ncbi:MAG: hypothetical protein ACUVSX_09475 [Aggregatilineales bacterium]
MDAMGTQIKIAEQIVLSANSVEKSGRGRAYSTRTVDKWAGHDGKPPIYLQPFGLGGLFFAGCAPPLDD